MKIKNSLIISLALCLVILFFFYPENNQKSSTQELTLERVIDGDTIELRDLGKLRLVNINTPESNVQGSNLSKEYLSSFLNKQLSVEVTGKDKYNRFLGKIYYENEYLNLEIVRKGFANTFLVTDEEKEVFSKAQREAIEDERGIWKKADFFGCFDSKIFQEEEILEINNFCQTLIVSNWYFKDESRKIFALNNFTLGKLLIYSFNGTNTGSNLFLNENNPIWNNDRDSFFLFNEKGELVHYESYGY